MVSTQEKTLYNIGNITERKSIITFADDQALAIFYLLSHTTEVQTITRAKECAGAQNDGLYVTIQHQTTHQTITLCFGDAIRIGIGPQWIALDHETSMPKTIHSMRTGMHKTAYFRSLSRFIQIFRSVHIHQAIVGQRTPHAHHACEMKNKINILHRRSQRASICNITAYHFYTLCLQLFCIFNRKNQGANTFTTILQRFY